MKIYFKKKWETVKVNKTATIKYTNTQDQGETGTGAQTSRLYFCREPKSRQRDVSGGQD